MLYDKDHYKLALGQLNKARNIIDELARTYVRMLKFGQNMFQCKQLKRAAMGRYVCFHFMPPGCFVCVIAASRSHQASPLNLTCENGVYVGGHGSARLLACFRSGCAH